MCEQKADEKLNYPSGLPKASDICCRMKGFDY